MKIRILGAHHFESITSKYSCFVIDGTLAVDAGALTSTLSTLEQQDLHGVLITHAHFDHIRDIPSLAANLFAAGKQTNIYATEETHHIIQSHLLNGAVYPDFFSLPLKAPTLIYHQIAPGEIQTIQGYGVLPLKTNHGENSVGFNITGPGGETLFYSGDTGPGLSAVWEEIAPGSLIIEVTLPNRLRDFALQSGHLTPELLRQELEAFLLSKGYLPEITAIHMDRLHEEEIQREMNDISRSLDTKIEFAHEGLEINLQTDNSRYPKSNIPNPTAVEP
jgi:ribonuclease BN (tRNA processing enzyme)